CGVGEGSVLQKCRIVDAAAAQLVGGRHPIAPEELLDSGKIAVASASGGGEDVPILHIKGDEFAVVRRAVVDDLIPRRGVTDVTDRGAELHGPEERDAAIGRVHAGEVIPGDAPMLAGEAPVLDADEVARAP